MPRLAARLAVALAIPTAALAVAAAPAPAATFGIVYNDFLDPETSVAPEREVAAIEGLLGARIHRYAVHWSGVQPSGPDEWRWGKFDAMYEADLERGIRPLLLVSHAPGWAWPSDQACGFAAPANGDGDCNVPPDTSGVSTKVPEWQEFVRTLVLRYPEIAGVEVWNEPNTDAQWKTAAARSSFLGGSPSEYAAVLRATHDAVNEVEPLIGRGVPVVTGGLHMAHETDGVRTQPVEWMEELYAAGAAGGYDKVGYHAYPKQIPVNDSAWALLELGRVEAAIAASDPGPAIWVTETGYSTTSLCRPDGVVHDPCTEVDQARGVPNVVRKLEQDPQVEVVIVFTLFELTDGEATAREIGFGLIRRNLEAKPVYCGLALDRTGTDPCASDPDGDSLPDLAELEAGTDPADPDSDDDGTLDGFDRSPLDPTRAGSLAAAPAITAAPAEFTPLRDATFEFSTPLAGATYRCSLDGAAYAPCTSPKAYTGLTQKQHALTVRAVDADGISGQVATRRWTIDWKPPDTKITAGPLSVTVERSATFKFSSTELGGFECSLDGGPYEACATPKTYSGLVPGEHSFAVRALDRAGNRDASPARRSWTVVG